MNCWDILGIAPTGDQDEIKKAFAARSRRHHPEDDPEGFKRLREAYQKAVKQAAYQRPASRSELSTELQNVRPVPEEEPDAPALDFGRTATAPAPVPEKEPNAPALDFGKTADTPPSTQANKSADVVVFTEADKIEIDEDAFRRDIFTSQQTGIPRKEQARQKRKKIIKALLSKQFLKFVGLCIFMLFIISALIYLLVETKPISGLATSGGISWGLKVFVMIMVGLGSAFVKASKKS